MKKAGAKNSKRNIEIPGWERCSLESDRCCSVSVERKEKEINKSLASSLVNHSEKQLVIVAVARGTASRWHGFRCLPSFQAVSRAFVRGQLAEGAS